MPLVRFLRENAAFLLAGGVLTFSSSYGQTFFISIFSAHIMADLSLSDGEWGGIYTIGTSLSAVLMIWAGVLTDHFRVRQLALIVLPFLALACLTMAAVPNGFWLIGVILLLRFFGQGMTSQLAVVAMARWFSSRRGTALSISALGFALGQAVLPLLFALLLVTFDWRLLWVVAAALVIVVIPAVLRLLRLERTPQSLAEEANATGMHGRQWTRADMLRHPLFWMLIPLLLGPPAWGTALFFQQVHLAEVKGWSLTGWFALMPLFTCFLVAANVLSGLAVDRFGAGRVILIYLLPFIVSFWIFAGATTLGGAALGLAIFALGNGMQGTVVSSFWAEYYGTRHLGAIKSAAAALMVFGSAIGPGITGALIDWGMDFEAQMVWIAGYFVLAALCTLAATMLAGRDLARAS